jgi:hypothetical protein
MKQQCGAYVRQSDRTVSLFYQKVSALGTSTYGDYPGGTDYSTDTLTLGGDFDNHFLELKMGEVAYINIADPGMNC